MNLHGVDIQVEGNGTETLVMLHGWPDTLALWNDTVQALSDTYQCVRFTLPASMDINDFYLAHGKEESLKLFGGV